MRGLNKISILLIFVVSVSAYSQYKNIKFSSLTVNDGLSEDRVTSVLQDSKGFMWFGTQSGLNRYDGYNFKIYSYNPNKTGTISSSFITRIYEDKEGTLWIGTHDEGLNRYDRDLDKFTVFKHNPSDTNSISENTVLSIYEDSKGYLWIGTTYNGIDRFDKKNKVFTHYKFIPNDSPGVTFNVVRAICEDSFQNIWIGSSFTGLYKLNVNKGKFTHFTNNPVDQNSLSENTVRFLTLDRNQNLWIGTWDGLDELPRKELNEVLPGSAKFKRYYMDKTELWGSRFECVCIDDKGKIWLGTIKGPAIFDPETEHFTTFPKNSYNGLVGEAINSIFEDNSGIIWFAVGAGIVWPSGINIQHHGGINILDKKRMRFKSYSYKPGLPNSLNLGFITSLDEDGKGNLWITNGSHSIWKWNTGDNVLTEITPKYINQRFILNLFINSKNEIWVNAGPNSDICKFNPATLNLVKYYTNMPPEAGLSYLGKNGYFYESSYLGLLEFDSDMNLLKVYKHDENDTNSLDNNWVKKFMCEDNDTNLWVSTMSGLNKLDKKSGKFIHYHSVIGDTNSINCIDVLAMYDDGSNIWFATYGGGLNKFNKISNHFTHITKDNGFVDNFMNSLLVDNSGNFWISSNGGISKYNPHDGVIKNYGIEDGLQGKEFILPAFKSKSGEMFFCGYYGLTAFFPDSISDNRHIPPVILTKFKLFDKAAILDTSITYKKEITLPYDSNFFSFEFAALDYTNPSKNRYKYKLEGVDKDWIYTDASDRTVNYTDIKPGNYIFMVKGSNNDGAWNEKGISIRIIITPPWWETWWFRGCGILLVIGLLGFIRQRRISQIKKDMKTQAEFTKQLIDSQEHERKRIAGELHDSLGQNLLIIKNKAVLGKKNPEKNPDIIEEISDITSSTLQEVREISYNLHPYQLGRLGLTKAIESIIERVLKSSNINFNVNIESIDGIFSPETEIQIYRIVQECVNNILKHSGASEAILVIRKKPDEVLVTVTDNGKGFDVNEVMSDSSKRGLGLMGITERAKLINGTVKYESAINKGSRVFINIKI